MIKSSFTALWTETISNIILEEFSNESKIADNLSIQTEDVHYDILMFSFSKYVFHFFAHSFSLILMKTTKEGSEVE